MVGVTLGKGGTVHLGLPVFNTVAEAVAETGAEASTICKDSILEAANAGIKLIVYVTLDMLKCKVKCDELGAPNRAKLPRCYYSG